VGLSVVALGFLATIAWNVPNGQWPAWALHREPDPNGTIDFGDCGDIVEEEMEILDAASLSDEGFPSAFLYVGDWNFTGTPLKFTGGAVSNPYDSFFMATIQVNIGSGLNTIMFTMQDFLPPSNGSTPACRAVAHIVGIDKDEPFEIKGPCEVEKDVEIHYHLILTGDAVPFPLITNPDGAQSVLNVRRKSGNSFQPYKFKFRGDLVSGGTQDGIENLGGVAVTFVDDGLYEMEVIWKMPAPPDAVNVVDVSTATKKVIAGSFFRGNIKRNPYLNRD